MKLNMIGLSIKVIGEVSIDIDTPYLYGVEGAHTVFSSINRRS